MHVREQIRVAAATTLNGLPTTGGRVYASRVSNWNSASLPGLAIYTTAETAEPAAMGSGRPTARELELVIEAAAKAVAGVDDILDRVAAEVEAALAADPTLGGLVKRLVLERTEIDLSGEGEEPVGLVRLTFQALYRTPAGDPETTVE